ncbi:penicillin-binding protein activator [Deferrisoma camini]|uniref:penicillin-binding protein activator n=1 Tax=Deferrisoma camini TaxID=1035120 RepID=UPI00046CF827|nr:penicillin-binding protein activator [Deferrisoma camini]
MRPRRFVWVAVAAVLTACGRPAVRPEPPVPPVQVHRRVFGPPARPESPPSPPSSPARPEARAPSVPPPSPPPPAEAPPPAPDPLAEAEARISQGEFDAALAALEAAEPTPEVLRRKGDVLVALGRYPDAVAAYAAALPEDDDVAAEPLRALIRSVLDAMGAADLEAVARRCPFCPEGGYARLRLARLALAQGQTDRALELLSDLEADFAGEPVGRAAAALRGRIEARKAVSPGTYGLLVPLTGPLAPFGRRVLRGAVLGAGLFGPEDPGVRLLVRDTRADPETAAAAAEELARAGAVGLVGPLKGEAARRAASAARSAGVPLVALTPAAGVAGDGSYRLYLPEAEEMAVLVRYAVQGLGLRTFAILYPDTNTGRLYRDRFWDRVVAEGGEITGVEAFGGDLASASEAVERLTGVYGLTPEELRARFLEEERLRLARERELWEALGVTPAEAGEPDAAIQVDEQRLAEYKPRPIVDFDAVFLPAPALTAAQVAPLLAFHDVEDVVLLGIRAWNFPGFVEVGGDAVEGAVFAAEFHPDRPASRAFAEAYRRAYGETPGVLEAYAHDALALVVAGGAEETRPALAARLAGAAAFPGVLGPITATGGDLWAPPALLTVRRGRIVPVEEPPTDLSLPRNP